MIPMAELNAPLTPVRRFWQLLALDKSDIGVIYLYAVFNGLVNLSLPLGIQAIINLIMGGRVSTSWLILVTVVIGGIALAGTMQIMQLRITENLQQKIFTRAAFDFAFRIPRMRLDALDKYYAPELVNRFFDTISVQKGLSKILIDFSTASLQVIFGMILLSFYHPFFILFSFILILLVILIFRFTGWVGLRTSLEESKYKYEVAHWLEELARAMISFKLAGKSSLPLANTDTRVTGYLKSRNAHFRVLMIQYILMVVFKVLIAAGLLLVGGFLVFEQQMNIGQFVAAEIIIILVISSVEKLVISLQTIYDVLTSLEKIGAVTDLPLERNSGITSDASDSTDGLEVNVHDLRFRFPEENHEVLKGVNLDIKPGERLAIVGPNGAGKSVLLRLLAGLYENYSGSISYNQIPLGNIDIPSLRHVVGNSISQDEIFEGTFLENITIGRPDIDFQQVRQAVENVGLSKVVEQLSAGYDTRLGTQGRKLPRSVINKIILARCIVANPRLILLEDWLGRIETTDRACVTDCLFGQDRTWTLVAITNDPEFANQFDRIAILENGQITAINTPEAIRYHPTYITLFHQS